jgi:hypothetical protein
MIQLSAFSLLSFENYYFLGFLIQSGKLLFNAHFIPLKSVLLKAFSSSSYDLYLFLSSHFSFHTSSQYWFCWANPHLGYVLSINTNLCNKNRTWLIHWLVYDIYLNSWPWANRVNRDAMVIGQYVNTIVGQGYIRLVGTLDVIANDT